MKRAYKIEIYGVVQGVGFRPFINQVAKKNNITGWVKNDGGAVYLHIEGTKENIKMLLMMIIQSHPPLAQIEKIKIRKDVILNYDMFIIYQSSDSQVTERFLPVDISICDHCIDELQSPKNMRFKYPFTNCSSCGPRYSIIKALPYDRKWTAMASFIMCDSCQLEYENLESRRFHTQPNCCKSCGPELYLCDNKGIVISDENTITKTIDYMQNGFIMGIKGIGGFHLCCDATNSLAVNRLRIRKQRPCKPFAIMAKDIDSIKQICDMTKEEEILIKSSKKPIVLLNKKKHSNICDDVAPRLNRLGVMLPYTPLHILLFEEDISYIVMTSGNISHKPICSTDKMAVEDLGNIVDFFLMHNREIYNPIDDSVTKVVNHKEQCSRLARGYAPKFIKWDGYEDDYKILAVGAEQKNTFSILDKSYIHTSPYIGDLDDLDTYKLYCQQISRFKNLLQISPSIIARDYHPDYMSTYYSKQQTIRTMPIQHHHAHMVSCMVEHHLRKDVIGVIYDGTGYGLDGNVWGGEFFVGNRVAFKRVGHLQYVTLQGNDRVVKEVWRSSVGYLRDAGIDEFQCIKGIDTQHINEVLNAIEHNLNCFKSSSIGRLFDCVVALIGLRNENTYDAQSAIELEAIIDHRIKDEYKIEIDTITNDECFEVKYYFIILGILYDLKDDLPISTIATKFHNTVIRFSVEGILYLSKKFNIYEVVISGGVFENSYLLEKITYELDELGFKVYYNEQIPINDSGISIGQAAIAQAQLFEEVS